jgi:hypothetical protein
LATAEDFIERKLQYFDSEASDLDKKQNAKKRKLNKVQSFDEDDFNSAFDEAASTSTEENYKNSDQVVPNQPSHDRSKSNVDELNVTICASNNSVPKILSNQLLVS